ncbi:MAG: CPBP family intramembrane glutamic endopeptidase [Kofleriaceae bacterium]
MTSASCSNGREAIAQRRTLGLVSWSAVVLMLVARSAFSFAAQALVAGVFALDGSPTPWLAAARWLPLYAALIDGGCLAALWWFTRREGIALFALFSVARNRWGRDVVIGLALIPVSLALIVSGIAASSQLVYGTVHPPEVLEPLPLVPAIYAVLVFPVLWGITEQMTYNGFVLPRLQVLRGTVTAVALVTCLWSFQHALQPLRLDGELMLYRALAPIPFSAFSCLAYLRIRRLLPFVIAHALMDGGDAFVTVLWPLVR